MPAVGTSTQAPGTRMKHPRDMVFMAALCLCATACAPVEPVRPAIAASATAVFVSDTGQQVRAEYRKDDTVRLTFSDGQTKILPIAMSGSGARYADGRAQWWEHQGEATYSVDGKTVFSGRARRRADD